MTQDTINDSLGVSCTFVRADFLSRTLGTESFQHPLDATAVEPSFALRNLAQAVHQEFGFYLAGNDSVGAPAEQFQGQLFVRLAVTTTSFRLWFCRSRSATASMRARSQRGFKQHHIRRELLGGGK